MLKYKWEEIVCIDMGDNTLQMDKDHTTMRVTAEVADELHRRKERGDSYDDVLRRLLELDEQ